MSGSVFRWDDRTSWSPKRKRRLPVVVVSRAEVQRLFAVVQNIKHKALFMTPFQIN